MSITAEVLIFIMLRPSAAGILQEFPQGEEAVSVNAPTGNQIQ